MKLATTIGDFNGYTMAIDQTLQELSSVGFRYADYDFHADYAEKSGFFSDDENYIRKVIESAKRNNITFVQAHAPLGKMGSVIGTSDEQKAFCEATKKCVLICGKLGIPNIVVHSGYARDISKEETFERNRAFYMEVLKAAEECGVNVLTENFNKMCAADIYWIDNVYDERELIDYVSHPLFHGCLDLGHNNMQDTSPYDACKALGEHLYALHVQDNLGDQDSHTAPFLGTLNIDSLMCGLEAVGYKGDFTFEATKILRPDYWRNKFEGKNLLANPPLSIMRKAESLLYDIGEHILKTYNCFEK